MNIHRSGVLTALAWPVPHETATVSAYNHAPCHFMQSHTRKVYACLAVTYDDDNDDDDYDDHVKMSRSLQRRVTD